MIIREVSDKKQKCELKKLAFYRLTKLISQQAQWNVP